MITSRCTRSRARGALRVSFSLNDKMKIKTAIKNWYRGKPAPPLNVVIGTNPETQIEIELEQEGVYIKSAIVKLFDFIVKVTKIIINFIGKEWRTIVPITITLISLCVAILALLTNERFMKLISR
jgi:hypothetical protein